MISTKRRLRKLAHELEPIALQLIKEVEEINGIDSLLVDASIVLAAFMQSIMELIDDDNIKLLQTQSFLMGYSQKVMSEFHKVLKEAQSE